MQTKTKIISQKDAKDIQEALDKEDCTFEGVNYSFAFKGGYEVDIEFVLGDSPYLNCVLFKKGHEVMCLDPEYVILGEFIFKCNSDVYRAVIKVEDPNSVKYFTEKD